MKKCVNCGKILDNDAKFCTECGLSEFTPLSFGATQDDVGSKEIVINPEKQDSGSFGSFPSPEGKKPRKEKKSGSSKTKIVLILVIGAIIITGIIAGRVSNLIKDKRDREDEHRLSAMLEERIAETTAAPETEAPDAETTTEEKTTAAPETTTEEKTTAAPTTKVPEAKTKKEKTTRSESDISPEFQAAMDGYEDFMDSYVEFMKNYDASDWSMLTKYSELMIEYAEWMEKIDNMDDDDMTTAEAALYVEVTGRVMGKLATIDY